VRIVNELGKFLRRKLRTKLSKWLDRLIPLERVLENPYVSGKKLSPLEGEKGYFVILNRKVSEIPPMPDSLPIPPKDMWEGYGETPEQYLASGRDHMTRMLEILRAAGTSPEAFESVLDFGCAAGRMLRFYPECPGKSERWGMDLKASTISWCQQNMSPPFLFATNTTAPQVPFEDNYFDFVYAGSVFTHIADLPDAWFLELRRILRKSGYLYLTIHDRHSIQVLLSQYGDRDSGNWFMNMLRSFDAETKVLNQDYGSFSFEGGRWGGFPVPQVFYDAEWLVRKWSPLAKIVSITPEAYGHQTALLFQK
jgi:SAM-dependent methyltransferase